MARRLATQPSLFPDATARFPSTRYQGSKAKLADWIWEQVRDLSFHTCLDAFGGTGAIAYRLKREGKQVTYNDLLRCNYYVGQALIANNCTRLSAERTDWLLRRHASIVYPRFVEEAFDGIYFTGDENAWVDQTVTNIRQLAEPYEFALAFFALCQACIIKRPYNLFHRRNLYLRQADVERSFGNKTTWDRPFDEWFEVFIGEANQAVLDNAQANRAMNCDAEDVPGEYDLVYIDTPYVSRNGVGVDYLAFYHFLEGLTMYEEWPEHLDHASKHLRLKPRPSVWTDRRQIGPAFERLFQRFRDSIIVISYRSDGVPSIPELSSLLSRYKRHVRVEEYGRYQYVLSTNAASTEVLIIGQ